MLYEYCLKIHFPEEAAQEMENAYQALIGDDAIRAMMEEVKTSMVTPGDGRFLTIVNQMAQKSGIHPYTVSMVGLLASLDAGRKKYQEKGYSETLFWESAEALTTKLWECKQVYDIWGTFVVDALKLAGVCGHLIRLRRNFLEFLKAGNVMGNGYGMLVFDGEKIV